MDGKKKENGGMNSAGGASHDLEAFLNPKSSMSSFGTFFHILWLKKWKLFAIWALLAIPSATFLAFFDLPKSYTATGYLRFPRVVGAQENVARDVSMGESESVVRLFLSQKVLMKTIQDMSLQFVVVSKGVFRKQVLQSVVCGQETLPGRYRFVFLGDKRVRVLFKPWEARSYRLLSEGPAAEDNSVGVPGGKIQFQAPLLTDVRGFEVDMLFLTPDEALEDFASRLVVEPLDKGEVAVNYGVTLKDRDPFLVADVVNELIKDFIATYSGATEGQDKGVLARMEKSIQAARDSLQKAQDRLTDFYKRNQARMAVRESNPYALATAQTQKSQIESNLDRLGQSLSGKPAETEGDDEKRLWMGEVLALLSGQGITRAEALRGKITDLERKRNQLAATLSATHPYIQEVDQQLVAMYAPVVKLAEDTRMLYQTRLAQASGDIMRNLPGGGADMGLAIEVKRLTDDRDNAAHMLDNLSAELDRSKLNAGPGIFQVNVIDPARAPLYIPPTLGTRLIFSGAAVVVTFFPGLFAIMLAQILFPRIWNKDDAERKLKVKVLGSLFFMGNRQVRIKSSLSPGGLPPDDKLLYHGRYARPSDVEAYRSLRVEIENHYQPVPGHEGFCLVITSTQPNEGKSLIAANLAIGFARRGKRTLLVDTDFRHGRQEAIFGFPRRHGLVDLLKTGVDGEFNHYAQSLLLPTSQANLWLMPRGIYDEAATEVIYRAPMEFYLNAAKASYEVVILDAAPLIVTADPINMSRHAHGVLFVIRSGQVSAREAARALEPFKDRDVSLGAVINGIRRSPTDDNYYARYGYYYMAQEDKGASTGTNQPQAEKRNARETRVLP